MTRRQRAAVAVGTIAIAVGGIAYATGFVPLAGDMCVTNWENGGQSGDQMTVCATPANLKVPNLGTHTENLVNGCQRTINVSATWSDCISSARVSALPANQRVKWFQNTSYGTSLKCYDVDGTHNVDLSGTPNDLISSFRVEGGSC